MQIDRKKSYLTMITNGIGTGLFRNLYVTKDEQVLDILEDGNVSCATFVSGLLYLNKLISDVHATVDSTILDMSQSGWKQIDEPDIVPGCVIVWEQGVFAKNFEHKHVGFYIGDEQAISNSDQKKTPIIHDWKQDNRGIASVWVHTILL